VICGKNSQRTPPNATLHREAERRRRPAVICISGETVRSDGEIESLRGAHMEFGKGVGIPIYVASTGPRVMKLAGQIGDGILLSAGLTHAYTHRCLEAVDAGAREEGRDPNALFSTVKYRGATLVEHCTARVERTTVVW